MDTKESSVQIFGTQATTVGTPDQNENEAFTHGVLKGIA
jgi:hypothetical protein